MSDVRAYLIGMLACLAIFAPLGAAVALDRDHSRSAIAAAHAADERPASSATRTVGPHYGDTVTVRRTGREDRVSVDYRPSARGPVWVIDRADSTVRVYGCEAEDSCRFGYHRDATVTITRDRH